MFRLLFTITAVSETADAGAEQTPSARLVARLRAGDASASRELWDTQIQRVRGVVWRMIGRSADVDDVVQEVFIGVLRGVHRLKDPDALDAFVVGVTANACRYALRKRQRRQDVEGAHVRGSLPAVVHPDPEARRALERLELVLESLSAELRVSFVLRHVEGQGVKEVAATMGWSVATTKRRLQKARGIVLAQAERDPLLAPYITLEGQS